MSTGATTSGATWIHVQSSEIDLAPQTAPRDSSSRHSNRQMLQSLPVPQTYSLLRAKLESSTAALSGDRTCRRHASAPTVFELQNEWVLL